MYGSQVLTGSDIQTIHKKSILIPCAGREVLRDHNPIYFAVISSSEGRYKEQGPFNSTLLLIRRGGGPFNFCRNKYNGLSGTVSNGS